MSTNVEEAALSTFILIEDNEYQNKQIGIAQHTGEFKCHCQFTDPCEDSCVNRELLIECLADTCPVAEICRNMKFQNKEYKNVSVIQTANKGFGVVAREDINKSEFIMEYVGEFITEKSFHKRIKEYTKQNHQHFYGMSLRSNEYVDATKRGGIARFCNHSCNPNCSIQQWIVNNRLRMGLFATRFICKDEELTFDYNFERFGKPQKCFCNEPTCRGYIGQAKEDMAEISAIARKDMMENAVPFENQDEILKMMRLFLKDMTLAQFESSLYQLLRSDKMIHLAFINCHGLLMLKDSLSQYTKEPFFKDIIHLCNLLPLTRKNYLVKVGLLQQIEALLDTSTKELTLLYEKWNSLKMDIIITKKRRPSPEPVNPKPKRQKTITEPTPFSQQRSPAVLIEDDTLDKDWKCYKDQRGIYYENKYGKRQTKRPRELEEKETRDNIEVMTPKLDTVDDLDVDTVMAEIEIKKLLNLKKSFEKDKYLSIAYKQLRKDISNTVISRLSKYGHELKKNKDKFKEHAKKVDYTNIDY
eukprot:NODE_19_length_39463_cov_0.396073.p5 type:complete len:528 gc:universal NODE_19_length_39463_cov_0.396073:39223-37640(-)